MKITLDNTGVISRSHRGLALDGKPCANRGSYEYKEVQWLHFLF